ncbi:hypothetical protein B1987_18850 [Mycobacterium kansasii]|uniref:hypothetical protein n=1 Tax=Mycobacterium attenuatum TaxID=2341086 RepID=UPI000A0CE616|nr:hypothetical protein [Mycobacterium attenuatum]ORB85509.1 hypothetical protein B1987_18850 [Mycobacterium kansasii]
MLLGTWRSLCCIAVLETSQIISELTHCNAIRVGGFGRLDLTTAVLEAAFIGAATTLELNSARPVSEPPRAAEESKSTSKGKVRRGKNVSQAQTTLFP